jgi:cytochrome b
VSQRILVWDLPVRIFHWALAAAFLGAFLTADSERQRDLHVWFGYTMVGLIAFRVVWAFVGTRYARFGAIAYGPTALRRYLSSVLRGRPEHYVGHNPPGALAIPALLGLCLATAASGYATVRELGGEWVEEAHEVLAFATLALVCVHVAGVLASSVLHRENLVRSMITGTKRGSAVEAISGPRRFVALLLVAALAAFWVSALAGRGGQAEARGKRVAAAEARVPAASLPDRNVGLD